jgi:hypothetical protein
MRDQRDETVSEAKGSGRRLWRLLPAFGLLLLVVGNVRHGLAGHADHDGARTVFLALFLAGFVAIYGQPSLFGAGTPATIEGKARRARSTRFAASLVAALALGAAALFSQAGWLGLWSPTSRADWQVVAMDLAAAWLYALHFHAAWNERGEADPG